MSTVRTTSAHRASPSPSTERTSPDRAPQAGAAVMALLFEHVPLSLLIDLTMPAGPRSLELLVEEGLSADAWWRSTS
ncbi:MAG: hypothetical protein ACYCYA_11340 [Actinomycetes bacterium]